MSQLGWWRELGAGVDSEPVTEVDPVVWSGCSKMNWSEGAQDDGGDKRRSSLTRA